MKTIAAIFILAGMLSACQLEESRPRDTPAESEKRDYPITPVPFTDTEGFILHRHGRVERIGNATTSTFALLPNPNPSGNFTKITQRVPVRIAVQQRDGMLRPGMMVEVRIATGG